MEQETFGTRLSNILRKKGITQKALADVLGVSPSVVSNYCKGRNLPGIDVLIQIAKYLNVSCDELLGTKPAEDQTTATIQNLGDVARILFNLDECMNMNIQTVDYGFPPKCQSIILKNADIQKMLTEWKSIVELNLSGESKSIIYKTLLPDWKQKTIERLSSLDVDVDDFGLPF